jgi:hypothetical protein
MLIAAEQWRKDFGVEEITKYVFRSHREVPAHLMRFRNFDFKEKLEVNKYYPQYYHKIDKVRHYLFLSYAS